MVWVISPDPDTRRLIGLNLSKRGLRVLEASPQGELALSGAKPHLIILDVDPPDESGWEAASVLRQSPRLQGVPLILVLAAAPTASRLVPLRPVRWMEKPLAMDALLALVRECLTPPEAEREPVGEIASGTEK
jgi:DNA-binding response OmpR family regulator